MRGGLATFRENVENAAPPCNIVPMATVTQFKTSPYRQAVEGQGRTEPPTKTRMTFSNHKI